MLASSPGSPEPDTIFTPAICPCKADATSGVTNPSISSALT